MMTTHKNLLKAGALLGILLVSGPALAKDDAWPATRVGEAVPKSPHLPPQLAKNLATFDDLDFRVYTKQQWDDLHKSHAADILVHYPDGHTTTGIPDHVKELDFMWTFAPDNRITQHPVRFGTADAKWTAVAGYIEGTFTQPMKLADGTVIQPTGKAYRLQMATLGRWNAEGVMVEEFLYWDNAALMQQIGLGK
jgi:hypothetical protein